MRDVWLPVLLVGALYTASMGAGWLAAGAAWRRRLALLVSGAVLLLPFLAPADLPTFRAFLGLGGVWFLARVVELTRASRSFPAWDRMRHAVAPLDVRKARRAASRLDGAALKRLAVAAPLVGLAWGTLAYGCPLLSGGLRLAVRWGAGLVFLYTAVEAAMALVLIAYGLRGMDPRPLHEDPLLSRTISEFWSHRWNQTVHRFLKQHVFVPVARRRGVWGGTAAVFGVSALGHAAFMLPAVGPFWAGMMGAFFLIQLPLVWLERVLAVGRWPAPLAHLWTVTWLGASSPLFVEPCLQIVDTWGGG
ncbi:MBOAT, membrane-bound O-acyltransferase family [Stigmatella aurantiaca]|uniref:MBOAT, membrane-bound O-acyltransferase family n=1 Tax=Stigmatella aurantiaca TaxID=41 RepID=A0A1H7K7S9_STIAU|nr:MBOAT family protein [Stigmatella aurantiaca]SEK81965.1 MBOAT, membrane-bound O-acyltransferase family [Stigmatella aurantiaca]